MIIVPTRNRSDIAINAVRSLLACDDGRFEVVVSDNSTGESHSCELAKFVESCVDLRLSLLRPPRQMSMPEHWDWALKSVLTRPSISHVALLTDRMLFKTGCLEALLDIVANHKDRIVSYDHDRIVDHKSPIRVELSAWSDEVLLLSSSRLLSLSSNCNFPSALPRLLNCVTPTFVLKSHIMHYGSAVGSVSPDYNFCYRSLALVHEIVYWDRAPIVHYALSESNGESVARGISTAASSDFLSLIEGEAFASAPCPGVRTVRNAILHEYCVARDESGSQRFPDIDIASYVLMLRAEIVDMENRQAAEEMTRKVNSWFASEGSVIATRQAQTKRGGRFRRALRKAKVGRMILRVRQRMRRMPLTIPVDNTRPEFVDDESARAFAIASSGQRLPASRLTIFE